MIKIPKTVEEMTERLDGLGRLLTAGEWERAAIVWAFTREGGQGSYQQKTTSSLLTTGEFAATIGESEILSRFVIRQKYKDGSTYQIAVRRGSVLEVLEIASCAIPEDVRKKAELFKVIDPWDKGEFDDPNLYILLWSAEAFELSAAA